MKHLAIASLVGAVILYGTLLTVHAALQVHQSDWKYTPAQDSILAVLSASIHEEGIYFLPYVPPGTTRSDMQQQMNAFMGKPWATVQYMKAMEFSGMRMVMGFVYNLIAVLILCIALATASAKLNSFGQRLWFVMLFAFFILFGQTMMDYNWEYVPMHYLKGEVLDVILGFGLVGIWLAWYYGRLERMPDKA